MTLATTVRRLLALGSMAGLGALLAGCATLDDPYAGNLPSGVYDRGGIYGGSAFDHVEHLIRTVDIV